MHTYSLDAWQHEHAFGQDQIKTGERQTLLVIAITATMMVVEICAGIASGSMALLADGLHMGSHATALGITAFAYLYARRHARDRSFTCGTGKVNALAGFSSAIILAIFALIMAWESVNRFFNPIGIFFNSAIGVAVVGLAVNLLSMWILGVHDEDEESHHWGRLPEHADHNLRSAYLHVLADAMTSVLAIFALLAGKFLGLLWVDALMGVVGAVLVCRWSWGLLKDTSNVLLDKQVSPRLEEAVKQAIEQKDGNRIADLHLWSIGPNIHMATISLATHKPEPPDYYKSLLPDSIGLVHTTVEVHECKRGQSSLIC
jgi:cation diffusion facilitator family transporter